MENEKHEILLGLTTTPGSDWRGKIEEIKKFGIKRIALFPTFLKTAQRKELYALLEKTEIEEIPHVHLREEDMGPDEVEYLIKKYKTQVFNLHPDGLCPVIADYSKYASQIFVENMPRNFPLTENKLKKYGGLCLDFSHWEDGVKQNDPIYKNFKELVVKYKIGCCHISAVSDTLHPDIGMPGYFQYCSHTMKNLSELDYMKKYMQYLPEYLSIELENSFEEQLKVKKYLEKILEM